MQECRAMDGNHQARLSTTIARARYGYPVGWWTFTSLVYLPTYLPTYLPAYLPTYQREAVLVGTKADLTQRRVPETELVKELAQAEGMTYVECSAVRRAQLEEDWITADTIT